MKKLYLLAVLVIILASQCQVEANLKEKLAKKIRVRDPVTDFNTMLAGFKYQDIVAFFSNFYWSALSPVLAGLNSVIAQAIYDQDPAAMTLANKGVNYWYDSFMIPMKLSYTTFFGYESHSTAPYPPTNI
ncbi:UNKNOWN [Stylonychia lemnae]|uniref:Uncharacterized protein n=1 Tax=Stylonychia lemnae TaxID=5949 RepID=A0A078A2X9_STYLE|nr:UNKNOWN [Stylonychia lemnae]|eukprot:CDW76638.1 UNKNOWN [Stylonychia lemnae]